MAFTPEGTFTALVSERIRTIGATRPQKASSQLATQAGGPT